jgi:hypothetical protein
MTINDVEKLREHVEERGLNGLLPQNLSKDLLQIMSCQYGNLQGNEEDNVSISALVMAVMCLVNNEVAIISENTIVEISYEDLMEKIDYYGTSIVLEEIRRSGLIDVSEENFPTVKNIFNENRELTVGGNHAAIEDFLTRFKNL